MYTLTKRCYLLDNKIFSQPEFSPLGTYKSSPILPLGISTSIFEHIHAQHFLLWLLFWKLIYDFYVISKFTIYGWQETFRRFKKKNAFPMIYQPIFFSLQPYLLLIFKCLEHKNIAKIINLWVRFDYSKLFFGPPCIKMHASQGNNL